MTSTSLPALPEYSDVEQTFEAHTTQRMPVRQYIQELWERREFIRAIAKADLRGTRSNTFLGEVWGVLDPLIQAGIYWFVVIIIRGGKGSTDPGAYVAMIVFGVFMFNYFRVAMADGGRSIISAKGLVLNAFFPRAVLPIAQLYKGLLELWPSLVLYAILHVALGRPVGSGLFLLPLLFVFQTGIGLGTAFLVATATVYVRDTMNLLQYLLRIMIFVTPVIYPVSQLSPTLRAVLSVNPLFPLFAAYQTIIAGGVPTAGQVFASGVWAVLFLVLGYRVFVSHERAFALRL
jgi:ABC-type polysaccharide/polyol phosphate export permease